MKEAFWGVLIVMLGLLGIVILQVFQNITITNDQTYYLLKEATEASMLDSIDLAYYRTKGKIKIVKDKFVENLARRFAESANINDNYDIVVHDIIEEPPKISLSIGAYVFSLKGDTFNIGQSISSIIESKYNNKTIGEDPVTPPECKPGDPGCGETPPEPPEDPDDDKCPVCEAGDPNCSPALECIPGDLRFKNWGDVTVTNATCPEDTLTNKSRAANYQTCECGKWKDASDSVPSVITKTSTNYTYTWHFLKTSAIRTLDFTSTKKGSYSSCIPITGVSCPDTYVGIGKSTTITPTYMPSNTSQRTLTWSINNSSIATIQYPTGTIGPTGKSIATVIGKKEGTAIVTVKTIKGHTDTCKVNVIDPDSLKCANVEMDTESSA
jgi:hypothetical protein